MKVVATEKGYLGWIREPGDEFDVPEGVTGSWFKPVAEPPKAEPAKPKGKGKTPDPAGDDDEPII